MELHFENDWKEMTLDCWRFKLFQFGYDNFTIDKNNDYHFVRIILFNFVLEIHWELEPW
jgi:hypothetical protein